MTRTITQTVDQTDGLPVRVLEPGEPLVPGLRAVENLGVGTRCETWLAWSTSLWHPVVVKLPRPHQVDHPRALVSLRREADALAALRHPATPTLLHDGTGDPLPHVVTEYVDGDSLADLVDDTGPLDQHAVAVLGTQLLAVLDALHGHGLAHVDVKPENVVVRDGRPYLLDFGSARAVGSTQPAGRPVGTPGYAAPEMEQCRPIDASMDVFGVGTVLAEALTGLPFETGPTLPTGPLGRLVGRLLAPVPEHRGSARQALLDLAPLCGDRPWPAWADADLRR